MAGMTLTQAITQARYELKDPAGTSPTWSEDELGAFASRVVGEISRKAPNVLRMPLAVVSGTRNVDVSALADAVCIIAVELPGGWEPPNWRNWLERGKYMEVKVSAAPEVSEVTLTGALTFTASSATVSGDGTAFTTQVSAGDYIKRSTDSRWYRVEAVASATALTLSEPYEGATGPDEGDSLRRTADSIAVVHYGAVHSVSASASTMPKAYDSVLVEGIAAYATMTQSVDAVDKVSVGDNVMTEYYGWGRQRLQDYQRHLAELEPIRIGQTFPTA